MRGFSARKRRVTLVQCVAIRRSVMAAPLILVQIVQVRVLAAELEPAERIPAAWSCREQQDRRTTRGSFIPVQTAVVVLAAGAGTRMRSKTPKVFHTLAGRSMLAHSLHAAARSTRRTSSPSSGTTGSVSGQPSAPSRRELGRPIAVAVQEEQNGTGHAVRCGLTLCPPTSPGPCSSPPRTSRCSTATPCTLSLDEHRSDPAPAAVTVLTFDRPETPPATGGSCATTTARSPRSSKRPTPPRSRRAITEVNSGVYAFDAEFLRSALGAARREQRAARAVPDRRRQDRPRGGAPVFARPPGRLGEGRRRQRSRPAVEAGRRTQPPHLETWMRAGVTVVDPATTWIDVGVTHRSRRRRSSAECNCSAPPPSARTP